MHISARQYSDEMYCSHCQRTWDVNDPEPPPCERYEMHVHKPINAGNGWVVLITAEKSPFSEVLERIQCSSREAAWQTYRYVKKQKGEGL